MTPHLQYKFGYSYTLWICPCGYSEDIGDTRADNKTTNTGGGVSDHTGNNSGNCKSKQS